MCVVQTGGRTLLASSGYDLGGTIRLWDPATATEVRVLRTDRVSAVCTVQAGGRTLLATGGDNGTVGLWDPATGTSIRTFQSHASGITAVCAVQSGGRTLLATGGDDDRTIRLWDPVMVTSDCVFEIPTRYSVRALTTAGPAIIAALSNGAMAIGLT